MGCGGSSAARSDARDNKAPPREEPSRDLLIVPQARESQPTLDGPRAPPASPRDGKHGAEHSPVFGGHSFAESSSHDLAGLQQFSCGKSASDFESGAARGGSTMILSEGRTSVGNEHNILSQLSSDEYAGRQVSVLKGTKRSSGHTRSSRSVMSARQFSTASTAIDSTRRSLRSYADLGAVSPSGCDLTRARSMDMLTTGSSEQDDSELSQEEGEERRGLPRAGEVLAQEREGCAEELCEQAVAQQVPLLELEHCAMTDLPERARALEGVVEIASLSHNELTVLPPWLGEWSNLQVLNIAHNSLDLFPESIGDLAHLQRIDASHNCLSALPKTVAKLRSLEVCLLDFNLFVQFPDDLLHISSIREIRLAENHHVSALPAKELLQQGQSLRIVLDNVPGLRKQYAESYLGQIGGAEIVWNKIYPDQVLPYLFIGSLRSAQTQKVYSDLGIKFVVTCGRNMTVCKDGGVEQLEVLVEDVEEQSLAPYFQQVTDFIEERAEKGGILVHCFAGLSRSATFVTAYLMRKEQMRLDDALAHLIECRPAVHPNPAFMRQLVAYDAQLFGVPPAVRELDMKHIGDERSAKRIAEATTGAQAAAQHPLGSPICGGTSELETMEASRNSQ